MRGPESRLWVYLTLAGLYFGLHSLLLILIPAVAGGYLTTAATGAVLVLYTGLGIVADVPAGRAVNRRGVRAVVLVGSAVMVAGSCALAIPGTAVVVASAAVLGIGSSLLLTPILGGLAAAAGKRQRGAQVVNACVQRAGGLGASLYISTLVGDSEIPAAWVGAALVALVIGVVALLLPASAGALPKELMARRAVAARAMYAHAVRVAFRSRRVASGLVCNAVIPAVMIFGFSFFPVVVFNVGRPELLGPALVWREVVAIGSAIAVGTLLRRVPLRRCVAVALVATVVSLLALVFVTNSAWICALFAVQGAAMALAIVGANVHIYEGTSASNRMYGYAAGGAVSRLAGITFPAMYGLTAERPTVLLMTVAGVMAGASALYMWLHMGHT